MRRYQTSKQLVSCSDIHHLRTSQPALLADGQAVPYCSCFSLMDFHIATLNKQPN